MKNKFIKAIIFLLFFATQCFAQGIDFKSSVSFRQIKKKAIEENKYIFFDIGATFCAPCHMMDNEVFTVKRVGDFYNKNFISVKIQGNKTSKDNQQVKSWYSDVERLLAQYDVTAYPTYLFFSPEGELVYRYSGTALPDEFINVGKSALDPKLTIKSQIAAFRNHTMKVADEGQFALFLISQNYGKVAQEVAQDYNTNFLNKAGDTVLKTLENLQFISRFQFMLTPDDHYFKLFYYDGQQLDSLMKYSGHSYRLTNRIITMAEVWSQIYQNDSKTIKDPHPNWEKIRDKITARYSADRASRILSLEKYRFYSKSENWPQLVECSVSLLKDPHFNASPSNVDLMNQAAFNIFQYSGKKDNLDLAINWIKRHVRNSPDDFSTINTYSCLLYKTGKVKAALIKGQQSVDLLNNNGERDDKETLLPSYTYNLHAMKSGVKAALLKRTVETAVAF